MTNSTTQEIREDHSTAYNYFHKKRVDCHSLSLSPSDPRNVAMERVFETLLTILEAVDNGAKLVDGECTDKMQDAFNEVECSEAMWNGDDGYDVYVHPDEWPKAYKAAIDAAPCMIKKMMEDE